MKKFFSVLFLLILISVTLNAQRNEFMVGGRIGLSLLNGRGGGSTGLQFGPLGEYMIGKNAAIGTGFIIHTQSGTPVQWPSYFKYYFDVRGSKIKPFASGGLELWFYTGGPYFGVNFGGGAEFPISKDLYIPAELTLAPIFVPSNKGGTVFFVGITTGIRYRLR
jgi:hypothetical protein